MSALEETLVFQMRALKYPTCVREFKFALPRRWRIDFAFEGAQLAVEVEGGTWASTNGTRSRHTSGAGMRADAEKYNELAIRGWLLIRLTPDMVRDGSGVTTIGRGLRARGVIV